MGFLLAYAALGSGGGHDLRSEDTGQKVFSAKRLLGDGSSGAILGRERCLVKTHPTMDEGPLGNVQPALRLKRRGEVRDMETLLIVLVVLFVLGGGGWGYRRYRR